MVEGYDSCTNVVRNTDKLLQEKSLLDFTVRVGDVELPCHRVILAASSHFFRALLMTDMKEAKEGCVTINGISLDIFQLILKSMYTGKIILNLENFVDIWLAADQLQIDFVVGHCEDFAIKAINLENFENISSITQYLNSEKVLESLDTFLLENFDTFSEVNDKPIMELRFRDFRGLIGSRYLDLRNEDWLIKVVLKWVEYVPEEDSSEDEDEECTCQKENTTSGISPKSKSDTSVLAVEKDNKSQNQNKRLRRLASLLKSVRMCLVSTPLLKHLLKHPLIINNTRATNILIKTLLYKTTHYNHGQWRKSATHRDSSEWAHCGVLFVIGFDFIILSAYDEEKMYTCVNCSEIYLDVTLVIFDSYLFAIGVKNDEQENSSLCALVGKSWRKITEIPGRRFVLVSYDECIFILSKNKPEIYQIFPKCGNAKVEEFTKLPETIKVRQAIHYQRSILIFSSVTVNGEEKTAVHQLDILTKKLTELEQFNGPAKHLLSFSDDKHTYLLQRSGDLWIIRFQSGNITFRLLGRLWKTPFKIHGVFTYDRTMRIAYACVSKKNPIEQSIVIPSPLKGYFDLFANWRLMNVPCSNFIPAVFPKNMLVPLID
ncbi:uncharacterized protein LOC131952731 [Physella acuta]|uniref:uncharacterized protein LOC131952731 n=1 Tax=Physella acuta TaxID=109671 RepID=UPI0027DC68A2|nr:uncharacterized protein LOC131952731 [Physella acuta]